MNNFQAISSRLYALVMLLLLQQATKPTLSHYHIGSLTNPLFNDSSTQRTNYPPIE